MCKTKVSVFLFLAGLWAPCVATTWSETEVDDPIMEGEKCSVHEIVSYGSYIYQWPSKYDQVFWPLIDPHGIWYCEKSGFTAFIGDFEGLSDAEKRTISKYLDGNRQDTDGLEFKLERLENIYSLRKTDGEFKNKLLRVLARWYQNLGRVEKANEYRFRALAEIEDKLETQLHEAQRLEYLYLAANYSRLFGANDESDRYLDKLRVAIENLEDTALLEFSEYLSELAKSTRHINSGGVLDPQDGGS